jgi:translocation protein SEC63
MGQGQFFPIFIGTVVGLVSTGLTWDVLRPRSDPSATAPRIKTDYKPEHADLIDTQRRAQRRKQRKVKRFIAMIVGWAIVAVMAYQFQVTARTIPKIWNPYDILGIKEVSFLWRLLTKTVADYRQSASEKEIKSHYKRLSLKFHPDKIRPDPAKNQTLESLNDHFVELTKAYKALTDEDIRNNYIQFGHPDGKQSFSIGIALPTWIVSEGNGKYVVLVYALLLGVLLPYLVGTWWYGTQRMSKEKILIESANNLFQEYEENITEGGIVGALSSGVEYCHAFKGHKADSGLGKVESRILAPGEITTYAAGLSASDKTKLEELDGGARRKALALLWAYLGRVELEDSTLDQEKYEVAPIAHDLNNAFTSITLAFGTTGPILASYAAAQNIVQALPPHASPLLQLPHITPAIAKAIEGDARTHLTLQQYMELPEAYRHRLSVGKGLLTESEYKTALTTARQLPRLQVEKAFFKVTGEKFITPSSLVSFVVKGRFIPPGSDKVPEVNELDLEDIDPDEDDLDAILGRKKKSAKGEKTEDKQVFPPLAFAPYFPRDHSPKWHVFLTDSKQGKIAVPPFTFFAFDKPIFDENGKPTFNMQTLKAQFQAPPQPGSYTFVMHLICDSYIGFDTKLETTLVVEDASKALEIPAEEDISEPDEGMFLTLTPKYEFNCNNFITDSLAGQMQALRTGAAPPKKKKKQEVQESSEDDSNTDEEADETSETDTDTSDEES